MLVWESSMVWLETSLQCVWEIKKANTWLKTHLYPWLHTFNQKLFHGDFSKVNVLTFLFLYKAILTKTSCQKLLKCRQKLDEIHSKSSSYWVRFPGNKSNKCQDPPSVLQYSVIMNLRNFLIFPLLLPIPWLGSIQMQFPER